LRAAALEAGIVDKVTFLVAPKIIGGRDASSAIEGNGSTIISEAWQIKDIESRVLGQDLLIEGYTH